MVISQAAFPEFQLYLNMTFILSSHMPDRDQTAIIMSAEFSDYSCDSQKNIFGIDSFCIIHVMADQFDISSNGYSFFEHL